MARLSAGRAIACALGSGLVAITACGNGRPAVTDGVIAPAPSGAAAGPSFVLDGGTLAPPGCGIKADGTQCDCLDAPLFVNSPTLYFVLDRSGSMAADDKWNSVRVTVATLMRGLGPRSKFGATVFPSNEGPCEPGMEILPVTDGDPPSSGVDGPATTALVTRTRIPPTGGTPTGSTLREVRTRLANDTGRRYVILATDGAPNCNAAVQCGIDQCQPNLEAAPGSFCDPIHGINCCEPPDFARENCNDAAPTLAEISALRTAGIPVYVVGLPGTQRYASLLDQMAVAGGTARGGSPRYFAVDDNAAILSVLKSIAAQVAGSCDFILQAPPNPDLVNVYMDDLPVTFEPANGWTISGDHVTLVGASCDRVKNGDALSVRIIVGCPRLDPK